MLADVARTILGSGAGMVRSRGVRAAHTLLFTAALAVSPGLCGACATGGCGSVSTPPDRSACTGVAVIAKPAHSCCGGRLESLPAEGEGSGGVSRACCGGGDDCDCLLEPRRESRATLTVKPALDGAVVSGPISPLVVTVIDDGGAVSPVDLLGRPPGRPVRVLYGVWRN